MEIERELSEVESAAANAEYESGTTNADHPEGGSALVNAKHRPAVAMPAKERSIWNWLMPTSLAALMIAVAAAVYLYYQHETNINENVLRLQSEAKGAALAGDYEKALALLADAAAARPGFVALAADEEIIEHAAELERLTNEIEARLLSDTPERAESGLNHLKSELSGHKEPIYDKLREKMTELNMMHTLATLTKELAALTTIKEHTDMLNVVNGLIGEEAEELREKILVGIRSITTEEVEALLARKSFTGASAAVGRSLNWVRGDEELLALQQRIKNEQIKYEQAEQQRIEHAMQVAAAEDLRNQTAAVEVVRTEQVLDEFGDLSIVGTLKNAATRPIYSVTVEFTVQNSEGETLGTGTATATPDYIEPGEEMRYTATVYGVYTDDTVIVVDHATWYLD